MEKNSPKSIGERIKQIRYDQNLTQQSFAKKVGLVPSSVSKMESGKSKPSGRTIKLICQKFSVRSIWLTEGEGPMYMEKTEDDALIALLFSPENGEYAATKELVRAIAENPNEELAILTKDFYEFIRRNESLSFAASSVVFGSQEGNGFFFYFGEDKETIARSTVINEKQIQTSCDMLSFAFSELLKKKYVKKHKEMVEIELQRMKNLPEE